MKHAIVLEGASLLSTGRSLRQIENLGECSLDHYIQWMASGMITPWFFPNVVPVLLMRRRSGANHAMSQGQNLPHLAKPTY